MEPLVNEGSQGPGQLLREQNDLLRQENVEHQHKIHELQGQVSNLNILENNKVLWFDWHHFPFLM